MNKRYRYEVLMNSENSIVFIDHWLEPIAMGDLLSIMDMSIVNYVLIAK